MRTACRLIAAGFLCLMPVLADWGWAQEVLVKPYLQPGPAGALPQTNVNLLHWVTDQVPGQFEVH